MMSNGPHQLNLTSSNSEGLDFMKKLYELEVEFVFDTWADVEEFEDFLNSYEKHEREGRTYRAQAEPNCHFETTPSDQ